MWYPNIHNILTMAACALLVHLRVPPVVDGIRIAKFLIYVVSCDLLFVCLSFSNFCHGVMILFSNYEFTCPSAFFFDKNQEIFFHQIFLVYINFYNTIKGVFCDFSTLCPMTLRWRTIFWSFLQKIFNLSINKVH